MEGVVIIPRRRLERPPGLEPVEEERGGKFQSYDVDDDEAGDRAIELGAQQSASSSSGDRLVSVPAMEQDAGGESLHTKRPPGVEAIGTDYRDPKYRCVEVFKDGDGVTVATGAASSGGQLDLAGGRVHQDDVEDISRFTSLMAPCGCNPGNVTVAPNTCSGRKACLTSTSSPNGRMT